MANYFEFYDLQPTFLLDAGALKRLYYQKSKEYHPDFYTLESEEKQAEILGLSTLNNKTYKTLADFHKRMFHVLQLHDIIEEEGKANLPQSFLMAMMDVNEAIMELQFDPSPLEREKILEDVQVIEDEEFKKIQLFLEAYDYSRPDVNVLNHVKDYYFKRQYLLRLKENLDKFAAS